MKLIMESWRKFLKEEQASEEATREAYLQVLRDEGGAAGDQDVKDQILAKLQQLGSDLELPDDFDPVAFAKANPEDEIEEHDAGDLIDVSGIRIAEADLRAGIEIFLEAKEEILLEKKRKKSKSKKRKKKKGKKDACYHKVRARYDVWPSAYASGALVRCRKVGAANWGNKSKKKKK
jgi:thymidylate kinase